MNVNKDSDLRPSCLSNFFFFFFAIKKDIFGTNWLSCVLQTSKSKPKIFPSIDIYTPKQTLKHKKVLNYYSAVLLQSAH